MNYEFDTFTAEVFHFASSNGVDEYHAILHLRQTDSPFAAQLEALMKGFERLRAELMQSATPVFKRYFLSDAANQAADVKKYDDGDCTLSIVQQPPLDGTKLALWAYLQTGVECRTLPCGLHEVRWGGCRHLWRGSSQAPAEGSYEQTVRLFRDYISSLEAEGCTLAENCIRTWFFVNDIDNNYAGVVRARNDIFQEQGLTTRTHFIASTGIGGRAADHRILAQMDAYAIAGLQAKEQVSYLYAPTHLGRTSDYGVSFERGTCVQYDDRRHVFISGTASIDNRGQIMHAGDIKMQTRRMLENVAALLAEADCTFSEVTHMIVYLRDTADYAAVRAILAERFPDKPIAILLAPVCRPGWLIEMECMAIKFSHICNKFEAFLKN